MERSGHAIDSLNRNFNKVKDRKETESTDRRHASIFKDLLFSLMAKTLGVNFL